jgi:ribosomal protein S11
MDNQEKILLLVQDVQSNYTKQTKYTLNNPDDEIEAPDDEIEAPDDEVEAPDDEVEAPDDEVEAPDDEKEAPDDEREAPDDEKEAPDDEVEAPDDEVVAPDDEVVAPDDEIVAPDDERKVEKITVSDLATEVREDQVATGALKEHKFKAILSVYTTKNNVHWVLTDIFKKTCLFKRSGGMVCKRGCEKNSQKVAIVNLEKVTEVVKKLRVDLLIIHLRNATTIKRHTMTYNAVLKLLLSLKIPNVTVFSNICNRTRVAISVTKQKYGRRGRRP